MVSYKFINKLVGKRILIFGGTSGIGHAVAEGALEQGADAIISGSKPDKLAHAIERLNKAYPDLEEHRTSTQVCDLSRVNVLEDSLREIFKQVSNDGAKPIDHVVFTSGNPLELAGGIVGTDVKIVEDLMAVRVYAPILIGKIIATTTFVRRSSTLSFTFTAGGAHLRPPKTWSVVAFLAGGLQGLAKGLAVDIAPVRVNVVNPGAIKTELFNGAPPAALEKFANESLTKQIGKPENVAEAYLYIMKDESVDGESIISDNGKLLYTYDASAA